MDMRAAASLTEAARLQTFLDVLAELMSSDFVPHSAEVLITDKHD